MSPGHLLSYENPEYISHYRKENGDMFVTIVINFRNAVIYWPWQFQIFEAYVMLFSPHPFYTNR